MNRLRRNESFSPLAEFAARNDFALCNGTVKRLASGRTLLPVSPAVPGDHGPWGKVRRHRPYSDDDGRTWTEAANRLTLPKRGVMEPHVEQAGDGRGLMVMRNQLGTPHLSECTNDGLHWSEPKSTGLTSPGSADGKGGAGGANRIGCAAVAPLLAARSR